MISGSVSLPGGSNVSRFYLLIAAIVSWVVFGSLQQLKMAKNGCCNSECGTGNLDKVSWWSVMLIGSLSTIILVWPVIKFVFTSVAKIL
jgi:hypothetical protein